MVNIVFVSACVMENNGPVPDSETVELTFEKFEITPYLPPEDFPLETKVKNDLGIRLNINLTVGSYSSWSEQFSSRAALGLLPDLVYLSREDLITYAQNGVIIPLHDYIVNDPGLKSKLTEEQWLLSSVSGEIYGFPVVNEHGPYTAMFIRKDWLDRLNLEMPTTTEELFDVLYTFTYQDPNRTGRNDTIGFTTDHLEFGTMSPLTNAFGLPQISSTSIGIPQDWIDKNGEFHFGPTSIQYKNYLQYMNRLMEAGVIDEEIAAQNFLEYRQKMIKGQAGVVSVFLPQYKMFSHNSWMKEIKANNPEADWVYLPPVKGPGGDFGNNAKSLHSTYSVAFTRKVLEEPGKLEKALKLMDYMFRNGEDGGPGGQLLDYGIEGIHHEKEDGEVVRLLPQYHDDHQKYLTNATMWGFPHNHDVLRISVTEEEYELFLQMEEDRSQHNIITNYFYGELPFPDKGDEYIREMSLKFIYGYESLDKWDEYVQALVPVTTRNLSKKRE